MKCVKLMGLIAGVGVLLAGAALTVCPTPATAAGLAADGASVDPVHSSVLFRIRHKDTANFYGVFKTASGSFFLDQADPTKSTIDVSVDSASIDTRNGGRDNHVKGPEFLSVKEFPAITFKSSSVKKTGDKTMEVTGDLTFRGVTKPVTAQVTQTDAKGKGLEARFTIKRSDFGNNTMVGKGLSDDVELIVSLEGADKK